MLRDHIENSSSQGEQTFELANVVVMSRPEPLRSYDQIWMCVPSLIQQTLLIAPYIAGKRVVFLGDGDCMALMLGLFGVHSLVVPPEHMVVLDFDKRLIKQIQDFSQMNHFADKITALPYNVFDPVPRELIETSDWFYANPPYGFSNQGMSVIAWISRCVALSKPRCSGCLIIPYDSERCLARVAMYNIQRYLMKLGFVICDMVQQTHSYHLDDDPLLKSSILIVNRDFPHPAYASMSSIDKMDLKKIAHFYGRSVCPPYPHYISEDGTLDFKWE